MIFHYKSWSISFKVQFFLYIFSFLFFSSFYIAAQCKKPITVRVLLSQTCNVDRKWHFTSHKGFWISSAKDRNKKQHYKKHQLTISVKKGHLFCNGKNIDQGIILKPISDYAECDGIIYDGYFCIVPDKDAFLCINYVNLEDYITAVLKTESWPGWPLEINKVFAIVCRSYVVSKISETKKSGKLYHVKNTNEHQTYRGRHDVAMLKQAVEQTKSIVLGFDGKPILAMFDSCCGSIIPAHISDFDFKKVPYLARMHSCNHCKKCSLYSWKISYEVSVLEKMLKRHMHNIGKLRDIYILEKDKAGLVIKIIIIGTRGQVMISGKQLYSALKEVKSFYFDINKKSGIITVSGRGFGHHLGLCQWGARQMVRDGWDYKSILQYYYPQTYFMKLL